MKVLVCLPDPRFGGPQKSSMDVAENLLNEGIKTEFLIPQGQGEYSSILEKNGFTVYQADLDRIYPLRNISKNLKYIRSYYKNIKKIKEIVNRESIDVINARSTLSLQSVGAAISSKTPLVWHFNDAMLPGPIADIISRVAERYADEIVVSAENVIDHYFKNKIEPTIIYPTVKKYEFNPKQDSSFNYQINNQMDGNSVRLGLVGNINPIKGYDTYIDAYANVADDYPNTVSMIVGRKLSTQKDYYQNLKRQISKNELENQIHFLGRQEDIAGFLSSIDLFVMPSHSETGPMTLMEAMMMKKPIVTTNVGVVPEQLENEEHAWIVDPGDTAQLAAGLRTALENRNKWEEMGKASRELALNTFTVSAAANQYKSVYQSAISKDAV